jgi:prophage regulatory protein
MNEKILRRREVEHRTGLSRSTLYSRIQEGTFPRPISLGTRAVGWVEREIDDWLTACIENRNRLLTITSDSPEKGRANENG